MNIFLHVINYFNSYSINSLVNTVVHYCCYQTFCASHSLVYVYRDWHNSFMLGCSSLGSNIFYNWGVSWAGLDFYLYPDGGSANKLCWLDCGIGGGVMAFVVVPSMNYRSNYVGFVLIYTDPIVLLHGGLSVWSAKFIFGDSSVELNVLTYVGLFSSATSIFFVIGYGVCKNCLCDATSPLLHFYFSYLWLITLNGMSSNIFYNIGISFNFSFLQNCFFDSMCLNFLFSVHAGLFCKFLEVRPHFVRDQLVCWEAGLNFLFNFLSIFDVSMLLGRLVLVLISELRLLDFSLFFL